MKRRCDICGEMVGHLIKHLRKVHRISLRGKNSLWFEERERLIELRKKWDAEKKSVVRSVVSYCDPEM